MVTAELSKAVFELPPEERLELARRLVESVVESVVEPEGVTEALKAGSNESKMLPADAWRD